MLRRLLSIRTVMFVAVAVAACQNGDLLQPERQGTSATEASASQTFDVTLSDCDLTVDDAIVGTALAVVAWDDASSSDSSVSNGKVVNNRLDGGTLGAHEDAVGILVGAFDLSDDFDPVAENNKVVRNQISGFETAVVDGGSDSKQHANVTQP